MTRTDTVYTPARPETGSLLTTDDRAIELAARFMDLAVAGQAPAYRAAPEHPFGREMDDLAQRLLACPPQTLAGAAAVLDVALHDLRHSFDVAPATLDLLDTVRDVVRSAGMSVAGAPLLPCPVA